jgi:hypothetical protein
MHIEWHDDINGLNLESKAFPHKTSERSRIVTTLDLCHLTFFNKRVY